MPFIRFTGKYGQARVEADHLRASLLRGHQFVRVGNLNTFIEVMAKRDHITGVGNIHGQIAAHHHFSGNGFPGGTCRGMGKGVRRTEGRRQVK
ncbi:hypothetical protein D3C73_1359710 [compost metagenome]